MAVLPLEYLADFTDNAQKQAYEKAFIDNVRRKFSKHFFFTEVFTVEAVSSRLMTWPVTYDIDVKTKVEEEEKPKKAKKSKQTLIANGVAEFSDMSKNFLLQEEALHDALLESASK